MTKGSHAEVPLPSPAGATLVATSPASRASTLPQKIGARGLWLWVAAGFVLLAIAWAFLFSVAHSAKIENVPLSTSGGGTR